MSNNFDENIKAFRYQYKPKSMQLLQKCDEKVTKGKNI